MFTINVADKHKVLSDLMNIFGKLHQKGFSDEQILNICHTFFKSEVEDNIDFCLKINKLESCASCDKIDEPTLHFKINIDFINNNFGKAFRFMQISPETDSKFSFKNFYVLTF